MNIAEILINAAAAFGDRPAVCHGPQVQLSYGGLVGRARRVASWLKGKGCPPGARVGLYMSNCPGYFEVMFGAWFAGCTIVPINAKLHPKELGYILSNSGAGILFVTPDLAAQAVEAGLDQATRLVDITGPDYAVIVSDDAVSGVTRPAKVDPNDVAWLFYTSGTTGKPKGAMLTHRNLYNMTLSFLADIGPVDAKDAALHPAPLSHAAGLLALAHIARGAANVVPVSGGFDPEEIVDLINVFPGSSFFAAPTMVNRLIGSPALARLTVGHLDHIFYGGAPMYVEDLKAAIARLGPRLWQAYGQGEAPCTITYLPPHMHVDNGDGRLDQRLASVGIARTGVSVRVVDEAGADVPSGVNGEVIVTGDVVMAGYWNNPEATAQALRDGWLHTGDIGQFDERGLLFLKDRSKDVVISGGSNIYPREVEEVLLQHPAVVEASVVGRPHADWGEEVFAFVVATAEGAVTAEELDAHCIDNIARFKRPKAYRFMTALPKSNYGKILKTELRKILEQTSPR
ncbi:AMP-binding protein [Phreatobacter stygius]|uniref:3-methylmercaptopropionyl-CoA ligase n=1 Tax=Phreatobacter stygius TaxID=1940610 RepID=A0A4D7BGF5_9HYPH|nr:AMP-binding protein [Phreatobacter stygius]QCI66942.1 long-chain fatty acid--CoA ligase [Phreatobacter stygius]